MPLKTYADLGIKVDNPQGTLVDITAYINQVSLRGTLGVMKAAAIGDVAERYYPGLAGATGTINGFWNTTTEAIFGPIIGARTSVTRTVQIKEYTNRAHIAEVYFQDVQISGQAENLQTFSASFTVDGAVTRTSVVL